MQLEFDHYLLALLGLLICRVRQKTILHFSECQPTTSLKINVQEILKSFAKVEKNWLFREFGFVLS